MTETKITKRMVLNALLAHATEIGNTMFEDFAKHELELLDKKIASGKKNAVNEENEKLKDTIVSILVASETPLRIREIQAKNEDLSIEKVSNQKMNALLTQLKNDNKIVRTEQKGVPYFSIA